MHRIPINCLIFVSHHIIFEWQAAKYCLLRVWKQPFRLNDFLTKLTVAYILLAINIKALVTLQFYAGWPYDGACRTDGTVIDTNGVPGVNIGDPVYSVCNQEPSDIWAVSTGSWMSEEQKYLVELYSVTSIILTVLIGVVYFGRKAVRNSNPSTKQQHHSLIKLIFLFDSKEQTIIFVFSALLLMLLHGIGLVYLPPIHGRLHCSWEFSGY